MKGADFLFFLTLPPCESAINNNDFIAGSPTAGLRAPANILTNSVGLSFAPKSVGEQSKHKALKSNNFQPRIWTGNGDLISLQPLKIHEPNTRFSFSVENFYFVNKRLSDHHPDILFTVETWHQ